MIVVQLVYIKEGKESVYLAYEDIVLPLVEKYQGKALLRLRPDENSVINSDMEKPYEVHMVEFPSAQELENYMNDEVRRKFFYMKEESVRSVITIRDDMATL